MFQRISGIALLALVGLKLYSGFAQMQRVPRGELHFSRLHVATPVLDKLLIFFFLFHVAYGLRSILLDLGVKWDRILLWLATCAALAGFCAAYWYLYMR